MYNYNTWYKGSARRFLKVLNSIILVNQLILWLLSYLHENLKTFNFRIPITIKYKMLFEVLKSKMSSFLCLKPVLPFIFCLSQYILIIQRKWRMSFKAFSSCHTFVLKKYQWINSNIHNLNCIQIEVYMLWHFHS